jgi:hypothetical protein
MDTSAAPSVPISHTNDPMPTPVGGTIVSGTYYLTEFMNYGGTPSDDPTCGAFRVREIVQFTATSAMAGTKRETQVLGPAGAEFNYPQDWSYLLNGDATMTETRTCGTTGTTTISYSATPTQYQYFAQAGSSCYTGSTAVFTYTKQ